MQENVRILIATAIERSQQLDRPIVLSIEQSLEHIPCRGAFHWHQQERELITDGCLLTIKATADRFTNIKQQAEYWLAETIGNPLLVGGFSFYEQPSFGIPRALFVLPEWVWQRQSNVSRLIRNFIIDPTTNIDHILTKLADSPLTKPIGITDSFQVTAINEKVGKFSWAIALEKARSLMIANELEKLVLARVLEISADAPINPYQLIAHLRTHYPECTTFLQEYATDRGLTEYFVGASPELFLRSSFDGDRCHLTTGALAGSIQRGSTPSADQELAQQLSSSPKNLREHQIVVNSILQSLQHSGAVPNPISSPQVMQLANVQHLFTPITAHLATHDRFAFLPIMAELHPTAAMAGYPRAKAMPLMAELEPCDRGWYASPIGWFDSQGNCEFVVGIRSATIMGNHARLFAGSGILQDSELAQEVTETNAKFMPLLHALGLNLGLDSLEL